MAEFVVTPMEDGNNWIEGQRGLIYDYGCALGDGTAYIQSCFPLSEVIGIDISPRAVEMAQQRWPYCKFYPGDIQNPQGRIASLIYTSHTLEHLENPGQTVEGLLDRCSILIAVVPPIPEVQL